MTTEEGPEIIEVDEHGNVIDIDEGRERRGRLATIEADDHGLSHEELEELRDLGIREQIIHDGGDYRQDELRRIYWFPLPALLEFERADVNLKDDDLFWDAVQNIILSHSLETKEERTKSRQRSWKDWLPGSGWQSGNNKISKWWNDYGGGYWTSYKGGASDSELVRKLHVALKAVAATVGVVNDTGKRFRVELAHDDAGNPTSFTDFNSQLVMVSPSALLDTSIDRDAAIEITTGYGLHEASHIKYSEKIHKQILEPTELRPLVVSSLLFNIIEDERIESLTADKFPGFADFFVTAKKHLWDTVLKGKVNTIWGPDLDSKLQSVIAMVKWPREYEGLFTSPSLSGVDPALAAELPWWEEWLRTYLAEEKDIRTLIQEGLDRLREDPKTAKEMDDMTKAEKKAEKGAGDPHQMSDEEFKEFLKRLKESLAKGVVEPCPSPGSPMAGQPVQLTQEQAQELNKLVREEFTIEEGHFQMFEGGPVTAGPEIEIRKPEEDSYSRSSYDKPGPMVERLRSVFYFRKKSPTDRERLLKQGMVDEDELWRAGAGDARVFERTTQPEENPTSVTLLVDISGSMAGRGIERAQALANVMMACLRTQRNTRVRVRAHSTFHNSSMGPNGYQQSHGCAIYRIWEPGDPDTRIGLLETLPHGSNWDGFAIEWCLKELVETAKVNETKVLIVLSDGLPAGSDGKMHYGGEEAMRHMRFITDKYERTQDAFTIQIAIDPEGLNPEQQATMFKHWIPYESDNGLLRDMTKLLSKIFGGIE